VTLLEVVAALASGGGIVAAVIGWRLHRIERRERQAFRDEFDRLKRSIEDD
jgi:hypothetical protein